LDIEVIEAHATVVTRVVEGGDIRYAYRRFGGGKDPAFLFCQRFISTMDDWDPMITNLLAKGREVILFNNAGVGSSASETLDTVQAMARDALALVDSPRLEQIDL